MFRIIEMKPSLGSSGLTIPSFRVLGIRVHAVEIPELLTTMEFWIQERTGGHYIAFAGMHGIAEAQESESVKMTLNAADLVVPDGMSLVWLARRHGYFLKHRTSGPDVLEAFCRQTGSKYRHFFYGGGAGVPELLAETLKCRYGIQVAGTLSPPFRALNSTEECELVKRVTGTSPDVLWVGLGTPKQERWMYEHCERLSVPVIAGVGAAFNFITGRIKRAPEWVREHGLEWTFRLCMEPRRLWRRTLVLLPKFAVSASLEMMRIRHYE